MEDLISLHNLTSLSGKSTFQPEVQEHCLWIRSSSQQSCWVHRENLAQNDVRVTRERHYSLLQTGVYQKSATNVGELQTKEQFWSHSNASTFKLLIQTTTVNRQALKKWREIRWRGHYFQMRCFSNDASTVTNYRLAELCKAIVRHVRYALKYIFLIFLNSILLALPLLANESDIVSLSFWCRFK